jgi:hypothetical protein
MTRRAAPMNVITAIGIGLIVIGVVALVYQGLTYTTCEKVMEVEPLEGYYQLIEADTTIRQIGDFIRTDPPLKPLVPYP